MLRKLSLSRRDLAYDARPAKFGYVLDAEGLNVQEPFYILSVSQSVFI